VISQKNPIDKTVLIDICEEILDNSESIITTANILLSDFLLNYRTTVFEVKQLSWIWIFSFKLYKFEFMSEDIFNQLLQLEKIYNINEGIIDIELFDLVRYTIIEDDIRGRLKYLTDLASGIVYINEEEYLDLINKLEASRVWISENYKNRLVNSLQSIVKTGKFSLIRPLEYYC
jgi:DNA primase large subunit